MANRWIRQCLFICLSKPLLVVCVEMANQHGRTIHLQTTRAEARRHALLILIEGSKICLLLWHPQLNFKSTRELKRFNDFINNL